MKNIILLCFFVVSYATNAQTLLFNKLYFTDSTRELTPCVITAKNNTYIVTGICRGPNTHRAIYARKIDNIGNIVWQTNIDATDTADVETYNGEGLIKTIDGNYAMLHSRSNIAKTRYNIVLTKFTENGAILWQQQYAVLDTLDIPCTVLQTIEGDYLIAGYAMHNSYLVNSNYLLIKTNGVGNMLWRKQTNNYSGATLFHAEQTADGGYIISGYNYHSATGYDMYAIKTDSLGTVQWEHTYGTDDNDCACRVMEVAPKQYVLLGCVSKIEEFQPLWYTQTQLMFARLDSIGNIINGSKRYYFSQQNNGCSASYYDKTKQEIVSATYAVAPNPTQPYLSKFSLSGELLLNAPLSTGIGMEDYLRDVEPTPDGGYVLAGFNFTTPSKGWVVKVDSLGNTCGEADCDSVLYTGINTLSHLPINKQAVQITPNPANNNFVLHYQLPPHIAFGVIELYNTLGQKVLYKQAPQMLHQINVSVADLPAGVYLYRFVTIEGEMASGKVIVNR